MAPATVPPAPVRLSTTTRCFQLSDISWFSRRATTSISLPGVKPTIIRTGLVGYGCACAACGANRSAAATSIAILMDLLPWYVLFSDARLAAAHPRQFPDACARGVQVAVDIGVDHARLTPLDAVAHRVRELRCLAHADSRDTRCARHGGKVRVVRLAGAWMPEIGGKLAPAEVAALQSAD